MATTDKKLKTLLFGSVHDQILPFCNKIQALHKSKAGPFHLAFCVGSFQVPSDKGSAEYEALKALPIPVYLQDALTSTPIEGSDEITTLLEPNLKAFSSSTANIYKVQIDSHPHVHLVVASCPRNLRLDDQASAKPLMDKLQHVSYVGCDFLLTSHWPQGMETLGGAQQAELCATYDVAEVALKARARYHVVAAHASINQYWQSAPFWHLRAATSTVKPQHTGRVIAVAKVSKEKKVPKQHKFVHALGVVPLHFMDNAELQASLGGGRVAPCPYTDASYQKDGTSQSQFTAGGLSEAQARRLIAEGSGGNNQQRWTLKNSKKRGAAADEPEQEVDPTNTTLFVHGLHRDVSGQLQDSDNHLLLDAFRPYGCVQVRRPPNARTTAFAFLEFETHDAAKLCLETLGGQTTVQGTHLEVKWGNKPLAGGNATSSSHKRPRLTEADAKDSSTLYFRLPKSMKESEIPACTEIVRKWMEHTLEDALNEEGSEERVTAAQEPALQVELQWTEGHAYGFLKFASHAAASMALATLTGSTDGGVIPNPEGDDNPEKDEKKSEEDKEGKAEDGEEGDEKKSEDKKEKTQDESKSGDKATAEEETAKKETEDTTKEKADKEESETKPDPAVKDKIWGLALHWAQDSQEKSNKADAMIQDADCDFQFKRQHFPADARQDCWFCLASEGCEKHLITGVYHHCYAALPKGGMHPGHVLLIPVAHSSKGAFWDATVSAEIKQLQRALRQHAAQEYDCDLVVFERAIQTRGGYHTHVQCVPVPKGRSVKLETTLRAQASANQFEFREIQSPDLDISTLLRQDADDEEDEGGYFYAEVPMPGGRLEFKRFLYKVPPQQEGRQRASSVPLQFGREVIAAVLGKSELAHWKSCQVDKEEETKMAVELRQSFEKYYTVDNS